MGYRVRAGINLKGIHKLKPKGSCIINGCSNLALVGNFADMSQLLLAGTWFSCTDVQRLMNSLCVQHNNWSKHSACNTSHSKQDDMGGGQGVTLICS